VAASALNVVYKVPSTDAAVADGVISAETIETVSGSPSSQTAQFGSLTQAQTLRSPTYGETPVSGFVGYSTASGTSSIWVTKAGGFAEVASVPADGPLASASISNEIYLASAAGQPLSVETYGTTGGLLSSDPVPSAPPPTSTQLSQVPAEKGIGGGSTIGAIAPLSSGGPLVAVDNGFNSLVVNLSTGAKANLAGYSSVLSLAVGPDGSVYVAALDGRGSTSPLDVVELSSSLAQVASVSTGLEVSNGLLNAQLTWAGSQLALYAPTTGAPPVAVPNEAATSSGIASNLFSISGDPLNVTAVTLPANLGLYLNSDGAGNVYLYGGPAENVVSEVPLQSASPAVSQTYDVGPTGSFAIALIPS
jgi:hypothetical protein